MDEIDVVQFTLKVIREKETDYACYRRYDASDVPDSVIEGLKDARIRLREIQSGDYQLNTETQSPRGSSFGFGFDTEDSTGSGRRVFSRSKMTGF